MRPSSDKGVKYIIPDGSARELHPDECSYLEAPFEIGDGARPYVKDSYLSKNGWGDIKGFLQRSKLPHDTDIHPAPSEGRPTPPSKEEQIQIARQLLRDKGWKLVENSDGTFTARRVNR